MRCKKALAVLTMLAASAGSQPPTGRFSGLSAFGYTRKAVEFGPRPAGSEALRKLRAYIVAELKRNGCEVSEDSFKARTPAGQIAMSNIIARFKGASGQAVAVTGHYDTKAMPGIRFVGANDGGASAGFLLELARALAGRTPKHDIYLVWFDGEESVGQWSDTDGIYGSRHLAEKWAGDGTLSRLKALINVDMIGDRDLGITRDLNSTAALVQLISQTAGRLGFARHFFKTQTVIEDDHMPFLRRGVPAVDLIDFDYGPGHSFWHTEQDTMDKLSPESFQVVGSVVMEVLERL